MLTDSTTRTLSTIAARSLNGRLSLAILFASMAAALAISNSAAAQIPLNPIPLNYSNWSSSVASAQYGSTPPAWYEDDTDGTIHLQGGATEMSSNGNAILLGTLPAVARPDRVVFTVVHTFAGTYSTLVIDPDGQIHVGGQGNPPAGPDYRFVSLEGITYRPHSGAQAITVNTPNWATFSYAGSLGVAGATTYNGLVDLQGDADQLSTSGANANLIGTLPRSAWPNRVVYTLVHVYGDSGPNSAVDAYADIGINPQGQIWLIGARPQTFTRADSLSLEGVSYEPSYAGDQAITVNSNNWSGDVMAYYGASDPGFSTDLSGVVHLQGGARQISTSGANANLLGTLPPSACPDRVVYALAHTYLGTYADIGINPQGQIWVIDPRPPAVKDYTFVSLEGISYQP